MVTMANLSFICDEFHGTLVSLSYIKREGGGFNIIFAKIYIIIK
jgi:hypothetical protein